jgi:hypothetical protein
MSSQCRARLKYGCLPPSVKLVLRSILALPNAVLRTVCASALPYLCPSLARSSSIAMALRSKLFICTTMVAHWYWSSISNNPSDSLSSGRRYRSLVVLKSQGLKLHSCRNPLSLSGIQHAPGRSHQLSHCSAVSFRHPSQRRHLALQGF